MQDPRLHVHQHPHNMGKGAAVLTGISVATGTHLLPFDADMEYSAHDVKRLLEPVIDGRSEVVYGTRLFGYNTVYRSFRYKLGNQAMTFAANLLYDAAISDLHTCLKPGAAEDAAADAPGRARVRARHRDHRERAALRRAPLRGAGVVPRPLARRGQEDQLARRRPLPAGARPGAGRTRPAPRGTGGRPQAWPPAPRGCRACGRAAPAEVSCRRCGSRAR
ncbi:hypothetical protein GCM10025868_20090 [Angustibacter aerolatus]|uniref:Glycosyltransferase 2-like domain-containing protein n=1 Tax=Angustibacter aerolatus TaxID=1162965 RepID=A0ABQ6JG44_9ACTN|nr:hypothetical protein GCM10025868_20090 [Angustibacter aerolatus]